MRTAFAQKLRLTGDFGALYSALPGGKAFRASLCVRIFAWEYKDLAGKARRGLKEGKGPSSPIGVV